MEIRKDIPIEEFTVKIEAPVALPLRLLLSASAADRLKAAAAAEGRTVSDQVVHLITSALGDA